MVKYGCGHLLSSWDPKICCRMKIWIELIFCMLTVLQYHFVRQTLYSIPLTFKCQSAAVVLDRALGSNHNNITKQGLSIYRPCKLTGHFLGIGSLDFLKFWHGARNSYEFHVWLSQNFWKKFFLLQKFGKWAKCRIFSI